MTSGIRGWGRHHHPAALLPVAGSIILNLVAAVPTARLLSQVRPGSVILLHEGGGDRSHTVAMVRPLIQQLGARGYLFVLP